MHPGTKRKLIYAIIAIAAIVVIGVASYNIIMSVNCYPPCQWVAGLIGYCDCPSLIPGPGGISLPEGIPGFPMEAILLGVLVSVVLILTVHRRKT